jgi:hypothetical protein
MKLYKLVCIIETALLLILTICLGILILWARGA